MDLLAAIKREERKLERQLGNLQEQFNGLRAAAKALGSKTSQRVTEVKKRVMSAAARAKISKATKLRWARFRAEKNKKALDSSTIREVGDSGEADRHSDLIAITVRNPCARAGHDFASCQRSGCALPTAKVTPVGLRFFNFAISIFRQNRSLAL